jgi:hypothetical protein
VAWRCLVEGRAALGARAAGILHGVDGVHVEALALVFHQIGRAHV